MAKKKGISEKVAKNPHPRRKATKISLLAILSVIAMFLCVLAGYSISYAKKTYSNLYLGEICYGGKSEADIQRDLEKISEDFLSKKYSLLYRDNQGGEKSYEISPNDLGLVFDTAEIASQIFGYGRDGNAWQNFVDQVTSFFKEVKFHAVFTINEDALIKKVAEIAAEKDIPEKDYEINYIGGGKFSLLNERQRGERIDQESIIEQIKNQTKQIKYAIITFSPELYEPQVSLENAERKLKAANQILKGGELKLVYSELSFSFDVDTIGGLIKSRPKGDDLELYIDRDKALKQLDVIAGEINREPQNALLQAQDGKVTAFKISQEGRSLDKEQSLINAGNALLARSVDGIKEIDTNTASLKVDATQPEVTSSNLELYGLKELIASGVTNFKGSSANRVHNITVGANAINGTLIKPGDTFSTLDKLGEIDASGGYLPELVIKENRTVPEYGGGLCQVSTTLFRAALNSGMEIISRSNHKYRVSYYEPPVGMDATIYDPAPDFKFKNNYNSHILIQANIVGTKITFDFYGTKDSRVIEIGAPEVFDYTDPGPAIEVPSDTLAPGERKQLEKAHQGCSAKFNYKVLRDGTTLQEKVFVSKYVAWPERWLVGIEVATPVEETPAVDIPPPVG